MASNTKDDKISPFDRFFLIGCQNDPNTVVSVHALRRNMLLVQLERSVQGLCLGSPELTLRPSGYFRVVLFHSRGPWHRPKEGERARERL